MTAATARPTFAPSLPPQRGIDSGARLWFTGSMAPTDTAARAASGRPPAPTTTGSGQAASSERPQEAKTMKTNRVETIHIRTKAEGRQDGPKAAKTPKAKASAKTHKAAKPAKAARTPRLPKTPKAPTHCTCGCGATTAGGLFLMGHDAKLKGVLIKIAKGGDKAKGLKVPKIAVERADVIGFLKTRRDLAAIVAAA